MSMNVKKMKSESKFERPDPLDPGTYPVNLVQIIGLGLQAQRPFKGEEKPPKQEVYLTYESHDEFMLDEDGNEDEDKPRWLSESIPLNPLDSDLAKSTKRYMALDPDLEHDGDFLALGGTPCLMTVSANPSKKDPDVIYNNVVSVQTMRAKDAAKAPAPKNPVKTFDMYNPDIDVFLSLPTWLQDKIKEGLDYGGSDLEALVEGSVKDSGETKGEDKKPKKTAKKEEDSNDGDW
jgi:hypothetical protein